jgi:hypothetical protein
VCERRAARDTAIPKKGKKKKKVFENIEQVCA